MLVDFKCVECGAEKEAVVNAYLNVGCSYTAKSPDDGPGECAECQSKKRTWKRMMSKIPPHPHQSWRL